MGETTYFAERGRLYMTDGPWTATLTQTQADRLLEIFDEANAVTHFNALWEAMDAAGMHPSTYGRPCLRLVSNRTPQDVVREMLAASLADGGDAA